jgi:hypothetical protein
LLTSAPTLSSLGPRETFHGKWVGGWFREAQRGGRFNAARSQSLSLVGEGQRPLNKGVAAAGKDEIQPALCSCVLKLRCFTPPGVAVSLRIFAQICL